MIIKDFIFLTSFYYFAIATTVARRPFRIEVTNVSSISYVDFVEINSSISDNGALSIYVNILKDISNIHSKVRIMMASASGNYDLELANKTLDACEFFRNKRYEPILQVFWKVLTKNSGFPQRCPVPKKLYFLKDAVADPEDLPPIFPSHKGYGELTTLTKNGNKLRPLYGFTIHAETKKTDGFSN